MCARGWCLCACGNVENEFVKGPFLFVTNIVTVKLRIRTHFSDLLKSLDLVAIFVDIFINSIIIE